MEAKQPKKHIHTNITCPQDTRISLVEQGIDQMKSDIKDIKETIKNIDTKISSIVIAADAKYATKLEVSFLKEQLADSKSGISKITDVLLRWGPAIAVVVWMVLGKTL